MPTVLRLLSLALVTGACAAGCGSSPSAQRQPSQSEREYLDAHPEIRILRAPGGKAVADELVGSLQTVGLTMNCARQEADVPRSMWQGMKTGDKRLLTAAAARFCDGNPPRITLREGESSKVVATVGMLGTVALAGDD